MITMWLSSFVLFASGLMMLAGLGLMLDAGTRIFRTARPEVRSRRA